VSSDEFHLWDLSTFVLQMVNKFKFTMVNCQSSGYMSPEYAMEGIMSVKSDVYSFGVLLLEIVSGMKTSSTTPTSSGARTHNLIDYVSVFYFI
jgi:serine/threonine protein kinase